MLLCTTQQIVTRETAGGIIPDIAERESYSTREVQDIVSSYRSRVHDGLRRPLASPMYPAIASFLIAGLLIVVKKNR